MNDKRSFAERRAAWQEETIKKEWDAGVPMVSYCSCCGAQFISQKDKETKGNHYTDCMWYEGDLPADANPH
jgi:hypothetical protein